MIEAGDGIIEDDWGGDAGKSRLGQKISYREHLLLAFGEDLRRLVLPAEDLAALCAPLTADELHVQCRCSKCSAFFVEERIETLVDHLVARCLGETGDGAQHAGHGLGKQCQPVGLLCVAHVLLNEGPRLCELGRGFELDELLLLFGEGLCSRGGLLPQLAQRLSGGLQRGGEHLRICRCVVRQRQLNNRQGSKLLDQLDDGGECAG